VAFEGFSEDTFTFLGELAAHNDREWFAQNKQRYEAAVLGRQKAFVEAMGGALESVAPGTHADPRVNGSIFRINRDTRFSRDKSPYKKHADVWFWVGEDRKTAPGYFVRITSDTVWIGGGAHVVSDVGLKRMREAIAADGTGRELEAILARLRSAGYAVGDEAYKRVPAGYPADHPRADLLRFGSLHAMMADLPVPPEFYSAAFVGWCAEHFAATKPLVDWLAGVL
jgi:uncharacterized protein (TIGR02453 family)